MSKRTPVSRAGEHAERPSESADPRVAPVRQPYTPPALTRKRAFSRATLFSCTVDPATGEVTC